MAGGVGERARRPDEKDRDIDDPDRPARQHAYAHETRHGLPDHRHRAAANNHDGATVVTIRHGPGHEGQGHRRDKRRQPDETKGKRIACQCIDKPANRHDHNLDAKAPEEAGEDIKRIIAVSEDVPTAPRPLSHSCSPPVLNTPLVSRAPRRGNGRAAPIRLAARCETNSAA